ncbi:dipeptidase [Suttonella sp. R2A3]|uniref:dipeptidase n=1 Tax=Suttonella sp. R2A3 TaxID=2908648 RepID=UPI001F2E1485|nr:membrane dipeptidase [Suttonella sp. R2A3]UJF23849.1 dipeptidase [Suttonella sp. R2A3]
MTVSWFADAHACLPLRGESNMDQLRRHYDSGVRYVSINVGMDMNPLAQVMTTIAGFRRQIAERDWLMLASTHQDILDAATNDQLAVSFDLEGALPLLESVDMIALYHQLGVRQIHLAYNRNNSAAGGAHDVVQGLTPLGEQMVEAIHAHGILMDLSHSQERTALDICELSGDRPVLFSHANPHALVEHGRNISDAAIKACAGTGGIIALNGVGRFIGDEALQPESLLPHIDYVVQMVGIEHTAIGPDYCYDDGISDRPEGLDPGYWWPKEAGYDPIRGLTGKYVAPEGLPRIAEGLAKMGYKDTDIAAIMRDNLLGLIKRVWG